MGVEMRVLTRFGQKVEDLLESGASYTPPEVSMTDVSATKIVGVRFLTPYTGASVFHLSACSRDNQHVQK